jgi:WD40 repeat protein
LLLDRFDGATSTLLENGRVLVTGGYDGIVADAVFAEAEIYNPATGSWSKSGSMAYGRSYHTATLLNSGKVLIAGGSDSKKAELYDPATGKFSLTGSMTVPTSYQTATLLQDGRVLIAGGCEGRPFLCGPYLTSAEIYDPGTGTFSRTGSMKAARENAQAVLLPNGKVLIVGGDQGEPDINFWDSLGSAELYDPATGKFTPTGSMNIPRTQFSATLLPNGKVLVAGGADFAGPAMAETYDRGTGKFTRLESWGQSRAAKLLGIGTVLLNNGRVLILGGNDQGDPPMLYDPATDDYSPIPAPPAGGGSPPVVLQGGSVLMPGTPATLYMP